jgi:dTDP-4-amino-4,6-dideoxygalactose transaminase
VKSLDALIQQRQRQYAQYHQALAGIRDLHLPAVDHQNAWACIRFPMRVCGDKLAYYQKAAQCGVDFAFSFTYIPATSRLLDSSLENRYPQAQALADSVLDLPFYAKLSDAELMKVVSVLRQLAQDSLLPSSLPNQETAA